ncbi:DUF3037 domain-containing protein [Kytococcus sp. Marseille-QA3725]
MGVPAPAGPVVGVAGGGTRALRRPTRVEGAPAWHEYQYAVIRCVPRPEREEFVNVGVAVHSRSAGVLDVAVRLDPVRVQALWPDVDIVAVERFLVTMDRVARSGPVPGGPPADVLHTLAKRFGWLVAPRSTVVQTSPVHSGLSRDPGRETPRLLERYCG